MSNIMAYNTLLSTHHHYSHRIPGSVRGYAKAQSIRNSATGQAVFKNILSSVRSRSSINRFKTRGLTLADYRAQPVISKSRFRSQPLPTTNFSKSNVSNQISEQSESTALKRKNRFQVQPKIVDMAEKSEHNVQQPPPNLTERQIIEQSVQKAAAKYNLPPGLIKAVIRAESNFQVSAVSHAGAKGLMQLMPATAKDMGVTDIFDIEQNIDGGAKYLSRMLDRFGGNVRKALAAYNAGPGTVIKYSGRVPYPETRQYVKRVLRFARQTA